MANRLLGVISALPEEFAHLSDRVGPGAARSAASPSGAARSPAARRCSSNSGAGKVNAGVATALLLDRFGCRALMMCGVAGGLDPALGVGDIVVGTSNTQHDYGMERRTASITIQPGSRPSLGDDWTPGYPVADALVSRLRAAVAGLALEPLPEAVGVGRRMPAVHFGAILTGDAFVNSERSRRAAARASSRRRRSRWRAAPWRRSRGAGARTSRSSTCAASATSPAAKAISISAPSCRSPRATPRRSRHRLAPVIWSSP